MSASTTTTKRPHELRRAWLALGDHFQCDGIEEHNGEVWQYMGRIDGQHEFRHRSHPALGRTVWRTPVAG